MGSQLKKQIEELTKKINPLLNNNEIEQIKTLVASEKNTEVLSGLVHHYRESSIHLRIIISVLPEELKISEIAKLDNFKTIPVVVDLFNEMLKKNAVEMGVTNAELEKLDESLKKSIQTELITQFEKQTHWKSDDKIQRDKNKDQRKEIVEAYVKDMKDDVKTRVFLLYGSMAYARTDQLQKSSIVSKIMNARKYSKLQIRVPYRVIRQLSNEVIITPKMTSLWLETITWLKGLYRYTYNLESKEQVKANKPADVVLKKPIGMDGKPDDSVIDKSHWKPYKPVSSDDGWLMRMKHNLSMFALSQYNQETAVILEEKVNKVAAENKEVKNETAQPAPVIRPR